MGPHLRGMVPQACLPDIRLGGLDGLEVGEQRRFRVDDDAAAAGQGHDEVGTEERGIGREGLLDFEVAVFFHARELDHSPELDLAPPAPHLGRAQGLYQSPRLDFESFLSLRQARQVRRELAAFLLPARLDGRERLFHLVQGAAHGVEDGLDALLALRQVVLGISLERFELGGGQVEETCRVRIERRRRKRLEGLFQPLLGVLVGREPVAIPLALRLQRGVETRPSLHGRSQFLVDSRARFGNGERDGVAGPPAGDEPAPEESQDEACERVQHEVQRNRHGSLMMDRVPAAVKPAFVPASARRPARFRRRGPVAKRPGCGSLHQRPEAAWRAKVQFRPDSRRAPAAAVRHAS